MKNIRTLTIAAILIFAAFVFIKRDKTISIDENAGIEQLSGELEKTSPKNNSDINDTESLRNAHTGQWFKNDTYESAKDESFDFTQPENTRNQAGKVAVKKDKKKKKKAKTKKKTKTKLVKSKKDSRSRFDDDLEGADFDFEDNQTQITGVYRPNQPQQTQVTPKEKTPPLTQEQWLELIKKGEGLGKLVSEYKKNKVSDEMFYSIIDKLMQSTELKDNQSGYRLLAATPSIKSFDKHIGYISQEQEPELQAFAKEQLNTYKSLGNLRVLNSVLNSGGRDLKLAANILVRELAETLLATLTVEAGEGEVRAPSSVVTQYRPSLQNTLTIINFQLESGSLDGETTTQLTQTKNILERLLTVSSNPAPTF